MTSSIRKRRAARATTRVVNGTRGAAADRDARFDEVISLIEAARARAYQSVNSALVDHSWELGQYLSRKIERQSGAMGS